MSVCEFAENRGFQYFDSIDNVHAFIVVLKASNPVIDNKEKLHRKSI